MSLLERYYERKKALVRLQQEIAELESSPAVIKALEFESRVRALLDEYGLSGDQALTLLGAKKADENLERAPRKPRSLMVFKNPHTGESIETKGGNHKGLKKWRDQYGADAVASWRQ